jgi:predicted glycosyltransferase involved in capsule biosynthesis
MEAEEIPEIQSESPSHIHVILKDGTTMVIAAAAFQHQLNPEDLILFLDADGNERKDVFMRASAVDCIVAGDALIELHPVTKLQSQVNELRALVAEILSRLGVIESARTQ